MRRLTLAQPDAPVRTFYLAIVGAGAPVSLIALCAVDVMSSRSTHTPVRPPAALQDIVERALAGDADSVSLEPVPEGLEVCWIVGNTGLGTVVSTEEGNRITRFIVRAAGLEQHNRGVLAMEVAGESREISVESYEHFGEWGYRLRVVPTRKRRRT